MPIFHRQRGFAWDLQRLDIPPPTPRSQLKKMVLKKMLKRKVFRFFDKHVWEIYPIRRPPWYQKFSQTWEK